MRTLCTIQTIKSLDDIPGKDRIKLASFESVGWRVIVSTEQKPGDRVVYCEPDTILPVKPEFEFLRARCYTESWNGHRIKRMKMGGVLSEGLAIPLKELTSYKFPDHWVENKDVTEVIGAIKYDPEARAEQAEVKTKKYPWWIRILFRIPLFKKWYFARKSKSWPEFMTHTDETRVQNLKYLFDNSGYRGIKLSATEKVDGQSVTYGFYKGQFYICSRNICLYRDKIGKLSKTKKSLFSKPFRQSTTMQSKYIESAIKYKMEEVLWQYYNETGHSIYVQAEQMGPGIQGNKYNLKELEIRVFNVRDVTTGEYLSNTDTLRFCMTANLPMVPVLSDIIIPHTMEELIEMSKGNSVIAEIPREGIVYRPADKTRPAEREMANMFSFKVINPDFLVKYGLE